MPPAVSRPERILVIKHGAFGDVIQCEGALHDIRDHHTGAAIIALTTPPYRRILDRCPWIDRVLIDPRDARWRLDRMLRLRSRLRAEGFDRVYDLQNSTRTGTYRRWFLPGVPWSGQAQTRDLLLRIKPPPLPSLETLIEQLRQAGVAIRHADRPDVSWLADDVSGLLAAAGVPTPFIVLIPGSSASHPEKRWPHYPALAKRLIAHGFAVVTAPGPDEAALSAAMPGIVLTGPNGFLNWFELAGLFARAAFVVGNDTGPSHLAAHGGTPGLALFGPHTTPERTGIRREKFDAIAVPDLAALDAETVLRAVLERLPPPTVSPSPAA